MSISICVLGYNKWNFSKSCLNDLFRQPRETTEVIFVDNGSTDETQTEASKIDKPNFKYIRNDTNGGFAKGCNIAYTNATNDNILFLNNDIRIKNDSWLSTLTNAIETNCLVGPTGGYVDPRKNFQFVYETQDSTKPINYMSGWCLAGTRATFDRLNIPRDNDTSSQIFSEDYFCFFEDTDLSFRAAKLGIRFKLVSLPIVHFGHITSNQLNTNKLYSEAKPIFIKKWGNKTH